MKRRITIITTNKGDSAIRARPENKISKNLIAITSYLEDICLCFYMFLVNSGRSIKNKIQMSDLVHMPSFLYLFIESKNT